MGERFRLGGIWFRDGEHRERNSGISKQKLKRVPERETTGRVRKCDLGKGRNCVSSGKENDGNKGSESSGRGCPGQGHRRLKLLGFIAGGRE